MTKLDYNVYSNVDLFMIRGQFYNENGLLVDTSHSEVDLKEFKRLTYRSALDYLEKVILNKNESHKDFLYYLVDYLSEYDENLRDCDVYFHRDLNLILTDWGDYELFISDREEDICDQTEYIFESQDIQSDGTIVDTKGRKYNVNFPITNLFGFSDGSSNGFFWNFEKGCFYVYSDKLKKGMLLDTKFNVIDKDYKIKEGNFVLNPAEEYIDKITEFALTQSDDKDLRSLVYSLIFSK